MFGIKNGFENGILRAKT